MNYYTIAIVLIINLVIIWLYAQISYYIYFVLASVDWF